MESPIKNYRTKNKLTQAEFGRLVGISQTMVSMIESGERNVDPADCAHYERITSGQISRFDLRPDIFIDPSEPEEEAA